MKSKLGILGAIVLSLTIAGSTFAAANNANGKIVKKTVAVKTAKTKKVKKQRRKHTAKKPAATMMKTAPAKKASK